MVRTARLSGARACRRSWDLVPKFRYAFSTGGSLADITGAGRSRTNVNTRDQHGESRPQSPPRWHRRGPGRRAPWPASLRAGTRREATAAATSSGRHLRHPRRSAAVQTSAAESVSGSAPSRRCSRSAGSSARMQPTVGATTATTAPANGGRDARLWINPRLCTSPGSDGSRWNRSERIGQRPTDAPRQEEGCHATGAHNGGSRVPRRTPQLLHHADSQQSCASSCAQGSSLSREQIVTSHKILNDHGLAVPNWPVEWGGKDWTPTQHQIWADEMQLACVPEPLNFNVKMVGPVIAEFGSEEIKQRFLPPTANLDIWWCQGFSEPEAGSDLASLRTTAIRDGDSYVVNGQKTWTTLGQYADWIFCLVRTDPQAPKRQAGISFLLFDMKTPGITLAAHQDDRRRPRGQRVVLLRRPRARQSACRRREPGLDIREIPAGQRAHRHRRGGPNQSAPRRGEKARRRRPGCSTIRCSRPGWPRPKTSCWHWNSRRLGWSRIPRTASPTRRPRCSSCAAANCSRWPPNCSSR